VNTSGSVRWLLSHCQPEVLSGHIPPPSGTVTRAIECSGFGWLLSPCQPEATFAVEVAGYCTSSPAHFPAPKWYRTGYAKVLEVTRVG